MSKNNWNEWTFLVVDDDDMACELLGRTLNRLGAQRVSFALDGPSALRLAQQQRPDFILLDLYLPEVSGWELLGQLRRAAPQAAVVMVTGSLLTDDFMRSIDQQVDGYCIKPVMPDLMAKALLNARARRASTRL